MSILVKESDAPFVDVDLEANPAILYVSADAVIMNLPIDAAATSGQVNQLPSSTQPSNSHLFSLYSFILSCWELKFCTPEKILFMIEFPLLLGIIGGGIAAADSVTMATGASILGYNVIPAVQAGCVGAPLVFGVALCASMALNSQFNDRKPISYNLGTVTACIMLLVSLGIASSIIGQLILHGGSNDKIDLCQLAKASALGMTLFATPIVLVTSSCLKSEESSVSGITREHSFDSSSS